MTPAEFAATVASMAFAMLVVGLLFLVGSAIRTLSSVRGAVDDVRRTAVPLISDIHTAVRQANGDLVQVEAILERTESIKGTVDSASQLALAAFATPLIKLAAITAGLQRALAGWQGRSDRAVFKRLLWFSIGCGSSLWVMRTVRRTVERLAPQRLTQDAVAGARSAGAVLKAALDEGRLAMHDREAELRAEIARRTG